MQTPSPNAILAAKIVEKLVADKLIPSEKQRELARMLEEGAVKEQDWRVYIELAIPPAKEDNDE